MSSLASPRQFGGKVLAKPLSAANGPTQDQLRAFRVAWEMAPRRTEPTPEERALQCVRAMKHPEHIIPLDSRHLVKFGGDEEVSHALHICASVREGCAILASGYEPVWSLGTNEAIANFPPLPGIETLTIFASDEPVSRAAAFTCAQRWRDAGREILIRRRNWLGADPARP
ncbi:hypothetical protein [Mesorhizobium sp.]|uniref:hypothetical protein n=1 Tax=Mesorhizobium sp. TaxID=1871066 RepID=UPI000FE2B76B|nr:hypothetical protein [Mesorhizobium sp.]RWJ97005.1 MAG: hypothetical protein EOR42_29455 [Mesorhizobium sp.]